MSRPLTRPDQFRRGRIVRHIKAQKLFRVDARGAGHIEFTRLSDGERFRLRQDWSCAARFEATRAKAVTA